MPSVRRISAGFIGLILIGVAAAVPAASGAVPLKVAYSDWPGWVAWEIGRQKGWLQEAGVEVEFIWSEYGASIDAFKAGKADAVMITNGDALTAGASGAKNVIVMLTDYSNGNDVIVAGPEVKTVADLKGKKVGIEVGVVEHLLLLNALKRAGLSETDVTLANTPTAETPKVFAARTVDAIGAWQPSAGRALKAVPGAHAIYTSADEPGLIYDALAVTPASLAERRGDWVKVVAIWDRIVSYLRNPATRNSAIAIMAARSGSSAEDYARSIDGTRFLTLAEGAQKIAAGPSAGFGSLKLSSLVANDFNVKNGVYPTSQDVATYFDLTVTEDARKVSAR